MPKIRHFRDLGISLGTPLPHHAFHPAASQWLFGNGISRNVVIPGHCSVAQLCPTLCNPMDHSLPGFPVPHHLPELAQTHVHQVGDAIQLSHPLSLLLLPSIFLSIRVFSNESVLGIRWPSIGVSASASVLPMNIQD